MSSLYKIQKTINLPPGCASKAIVTEKTVITLLPNICIELPNTVMQDVQQQHLEVKIENTEALGARIWLPEILGA